MQQSEFLHIVGIIGILTADLVDNVFGVEMIHQAVEDAKVNAEMNGKNDDFKSQKLSNLL